MTRPLTAFTSRLTRLWRTDAPLTATGLLMLALFAVCLVGLWVDPRSITNAPAWLKPAKFAISIAIYVLTLAWIFSFLPQWRRTRQWAGAVSVAVFVVEFALIALQAWRGTASHFNVGTTLDALVFAIMGVSIVLQTLAAVAVAIALWRQRFADRALGVALRLGMTISIAGASAAGFMTAPTAAQREAQRAGARVTVVGGHTVGAPDGGPGLPGTGWSRAHGDIRVAHFFGLHAMQALPALALALAWRRRIAAPRRAQLVQVAAGSYAALFGLLLWQALRGQSILQPDTTTLAAVVTWAAVTTAAAAVLLARRPAVQGRIAVL